MLSSLLLLLALPPQDAPNQLRDTLLSLEKKDIEAWKSKDTSFPASYLADTFIAYGPSGKLNKAAAIKEYTSHNCKLNTYALSREHLTQLAPNIALLTYKKTLDGDCAGQKLPTASSSANVFIKHSNQWQSTFYAESTIVDPQAAGQLTPTTLDPETQLLHNLEQAIWQAWANQDRARLEALTTPQISFINIFGTFFPTKADALKDWTSHNCQVKSTAVTNTAATYLSPTVAILNFNGSADGTCFGQKIGPILGTSIYVKQNNQWKWTFGINIPAKN